MLFYAFPLNTFYGSWRQRSEGFADQSGGLTVVTGWNAFALDG
jgi:hypothetical protein